MFNFTSDGLYFKFRATNIPITQTNKTVFLIYTVQRIIFSKLIIFVKSIHYFLDDILFGQVRLTM